MPRARKKRTIFHIPPSNRFSPNEQTLGEVILQLDELEAIRLVDLEHLDQSACAQRMNVARTTAQNIINSAHEKIADALSNGKQITIIEGDCNYIEDDEYGCCRNIMHSIQQVGGLSQMEKSLIQTGKENNLMILAITYDPENEEIFQHFGKTEYFKVYDIDSDNKTIKGSKVVDTNGQGHGALAGVLKELGANALICGGIGGGAQAALADAGIRLFGGVTGKSDEAANAFVAGNLSYQEDVVCNHHGEHHHEGGCDHHENGHDGGCGHGCHSH